MDELDDVHRDLLAAAVAGSDTWRQVFSCIGLTETDHGITVLTNQATALGIATAHLRRRRSWTTLDPDQLRQVVAASIRMADVFRQLGLAPGGASYRKMEKLLARHGIDFAHLARPAAGRAQRAGFTVTDDDLRAAFDGARSIAQILRRVGLVARGENYATVRRRLAELGLDPRCLPGQAWARGRRLPRRPLEELLCKGVQVSGGTLLARLFAEGVFERRCYDCGATTWQGQPIPLELEHINGDHTDNRLENLKPLCPNCHALTPTYRGRNIRLRRLRAGTVN